MSDTLPASAHRVNSSGNCSISGCPCRGWSAQETATATKKSDNDYQRERFPVGTVIEAVVPIGRSTVADALPVGIRGKVTSHCDDGRAWVFFDGYDEGHTFHEIEKFVRVVQLPVKEPQLTNLQKAVIEHDDDCARLDRNTLTTAS